MSIYLLLALLAAEPFELVQLDEGVYAALVRPRPPMYVFANALIILDEDGVTVVDTHQSPSAAEALIGKIRELTDEPVRFVINTHWHGDHVYGNQTYRKHFPDVVFVGHRTIRDDMLEQGAARLEEELRTLPESIRERASWLESGRAPNGEALTAEERERVEYSYRMRSEYLGELESLELLPPELLFEDELVLHRPGRTIRLLHFGKAHTRGDVVVYLPEEKILAAGDLLEDAFPYFGDAYPSGWADVLEKIGRLDASIVLPSHGPVLRDRELLEMETRMVRTLVEEVSRVVAEGMTLEESLETVTLSEFAEFFPGSFESGVKTAVERAYLEATESHPLR